ncbi:uncharacterized protein LOC122382314 [Amphibalanus amphitrite]|uniref:uncharacterized protein LOC122382314 n=1 Tax=Amphibalanus amphitrite TaxID=1232801 RepID=UPI001C91BFB9|nr:uncharacterized protein LOC122382314 [Amphibalanus amphitrite]
MARLMLMVSALLTLTALSTGTLSAGGLSVSASGCAGPLCRFHQIKRRKEAAILKVLSPVSARDTLKPSRSGAAGGDEPMAVIVPKERLPAAGTDAPPAAGADAAPVAAGPLTPSDPAGPAATLPAGGSRVQADAAVQQSTSGTVETTQVGAQVIAVRDTADDRRGVSVTGGLAVAGNLQVGTPLGSISISDAKAQTVQQSKTIPLPLLNGTLRSRQ